MKPFSFISKYKNSYYDCSNNMKVIAIHNIKNIPNTYYKLSQLLKIDDLNIDKLMEISNSFNIIRYSTPTIQNLQVLKSLKELIECQQSNIEICESIILNINIIMSYTDNSFPESMIYVEICNTVIDVLYKEFNNWRTSLKNFMNTIILPPGVVIAYSIEHTNKLDCSNYFSEIITRCNEKELFFLTCVEYFLNNDLHKILANSKMNDIDNINDSNDSNDIFRDIIIKLEKDWNCQQCENKE